MALFVTIHSSSSNMLISSQPFQSAAAPTSFEGPFGKILYRVRATIDTARFSKDYKAQKPFYLLNMLNLNEVSDMEVSVW